MSQPHLNRLVVGGRHERLAITAEVDAPHRGRVCPKHGGLAFAAGVGTLTQETRSSDTRAQEHIEALPTLRSPSKLMQACAPRGPTRCLKIISLPNGWGKPRIPLPTPQLEPQLLMARLQKQRRFPP